MEAENIPRGPPKCLVPLATPIQSAPNTPTDFVEKENNDRYEQAVFVQKILKGRCIQKLIHQNRNQLIGELQSTHQLSSIEQLFPEQKAIMEKWKEEIEKLKEEREILENKELMKQMLDEQGCTDTAQLIEFLGQVSLFIEIEQINSILFSYRNSNDCKNRRNAKPYIC